MCVRACVRSKTGANDILYCAKACVRFVTRENDLVEKVGISSEASFPMLLVQLLKCLASELQVRIQDVVGATLGGWAVPTLKKKCIWER